MTISSGLSVIDFDFPSLDFLVEALFPETYQSDDQVSPVTLICRDDHGNLCAYQHSPSADAWTMSYIGNSMFVVEGTYTPFDASSYDDESGVARFFSSHAEASSFLSTEGQDDADEYGYSHWKHITPPHCELPQFWSFFRAQMCLLPA